MFVSISFVFDGHNMFFDILMFDRGECIFDNDNSLFIDTMCIFCVLC